MRNNAFFLQIVNKYIGHISILTKLHTQGNLFGKTNLLTPNDAVEGSSYI